MADVSGAYITQVLQQYGLASLTDWALQAIINDWSQDQILLELYKRDEFKKRFPAIFSRESSGLPAISVDEYIAYEKMANAGAAMWGMTLSKDEIDNLLSNDVSNIEFNARLDLVAEAVNNTPPEAIDALHRMNPNLQSGDLMRYFMNPKEELGKLQSSFRQAQIAGAAARTGWGQLSQEQATRLQQVGLTQEQSVTGFGQLAKMGEIMNPFSISEDLITQDEQVAFLAGDVDAAAKIETRQRQRVGEFAGSGSFAQGQEGFAVGAAPES